MNKTPTPPPASEDDYGAEPPESEAAFDLQEDSTAAPPMPRIADNCATRWDGKKVPSEAEARQ